MNESILALGHDMGLDTFDSSSGELSQQYSNLKDVACGKKSGIKFDPEKTFKSDRIAQKAVKIPVFDSLANWREINIPKLKSHDKRLDMVEVFKEAGELSRLYGRALIFPIIKYKDTGRPVSAKTPLEKIIRPVEISNCVVSCDFLDSDQKDEDICSDNYMKPLFYKRGDVEIHYTRCLIVGGDCPFFQSIVGFLCDLHTSTARLYEAMRRNGSFVYKADFDAASRMIDKALAVGNNPKTTLQIVAETKAKIAKQNLKENNVLTIGLTEDIEHFQVQTIDDLIAARDQDLRVFACLAGLLPIHLGVQSSSGLNSGNFQNTEIYSQSLDSYRSENIDKPLRKMDSIIAFIYKFKYDRDKWKWKDTKAEEMLVRLRGSESAQETNVSDNNE